MNQEAEKLSVWVIALIIAAVLSIVFLLKPFLGVAVSFWMMLNG